MIDDWNDVKVFLALAENVRLADAARKLGSSVSTVFRRLNRIEAQLGTQVFERRPEGYRLNAAGEELLNHARAIDDRFQQLNLDLAAKDFQPEGRIRVTTVDTIATHVLSPLLTEFHETFPGIQVELSVTSRYRDLSRYEADIAIRATIHPPETLVGFTWLNPEFALYASQAYIRRFGMIKDKGQVDQHRFVMPSDLLAAGPMIKQIFDFLPPGYESSMTTNSLLNVFSLVTNGYGWSILPDYLTHNKPELVRAPIETLAYRSQIWVLMHPHLTEVARFRAFTTFLKARTQYPNPL